MMLLFNVLIFKLRNLLDTIIYWLITYYFFGKDIMLSVNY